MRPSFCSPTPKLLILQVETILQEAPDRRQFSTPGGRLSRRRTVMYSLPCLSTSDVFSAIPEEAVACVSPELQRLIQLQDIDVRIFELTDRLAAIPVEREQIEAEFRQQASE